MCSCSLRESLISQFHLRQTRWIANSVVASRHKKMSSKSSVVARTWVCACASGASIVRKTIFAEASLRLLYDVHIRTVIQLFLIF
jgi:hypothetical protein